MTSRHTLPCSPAKGGAVLALILSLLAPILSGLPTRRAPGKIAAALIPEVIANTSHGPGAPGTFRLPAGGP